MAQATFSVRMDEELKKQFDELCVDFGMNSTTAFNVFARAVVRERRIPFEITSKAKSKNLTTGQNAFFALRNQVQDSDLSNMSLDLINEEINSARRENNI